MGKGLVCPECGSWYADSEDPNLMSLGVRIGDICGNEAMTGKHPEKCSPDHPCKGRLIPAEEKPKKVKN